MDVATLGSAKDVFLVDVHLLLSSKRAVKGT